MPQVNLITANAQAAVPRLPVPPEQAYGSDAGKGLVGFGEALVRTGRALDAQADELDATMRASQYDQGVADARAKALAHPIAAERPEIFKNLLNENLTTLQEDARSTAVGKALYLHQQRTLPNTMVQFQTDNLHQQADENMAALDVLIADTATNIPKMPMAWQRDEAMGAVRANLDRAVASGLMNHATAEAKWTAFEQKHLEADMDYRAQTDPQTMRFLDNRGAFDKLDPIKRLKILSETAAREDHARSMQDKAFKNIQGSMDDYLQAQANQGLIPADIMDQGLKGKDPIMTDPAKWREYQRINNNPPIGGKVPSVGVLMQSYHLEPSTLQNIAKARKALNELARALGHPSPEIDKAANELQTDERTMRSVQAAEMQAGLHYGEDLMKSKGEMQFPGRLGQMQKNLDEIDKAEMRTRIRKGEKPDAVVKDITERKKRQQEEIPKHNKGVLDLVK